jgi:sulfite oxidase
MHEPSELSGDLTNSDWRLTVGGEVDKPFALTFSELSKLETHSVVNTLECAGNGRSLHRPQVPGIQWGKGAVGTARFSGSRLRDILQRAGIKPTGKHVMFRGLDEVPGKVPAFIRSIPIEKALDTDTLVATHMNGAPLTKHHGFPARVLVPGWIGAASCKWLTEIKVLDSEFVGNFMSPGYRFPNQPVKPGDAVKPEDTHPLTALNVKSVIAGPLEGASLKAGKVAVHGAAWAGESNVVKVEYQPTAAPVGILPASATTKPIMRGVYGSMSGRRRAATTRFFPAPPIPRGEPSLPLQHGIRADTLQRCRSGEDPCRMNGSRM